MLHLRLVVDTNVLISAAIKPAGLPRTVLLVAITPPARFYVSRPILKEYRTVLKRPELCISKDIQHQIAPTHREQKSHAWSQHVVLTSVPIPMTTCSWSVLMPRARPI
jgi:predicted nucleic acid-binding protein